MPIATALNPAPTQLGRLTDAFDLFSNATQKLEQAYGDLHTRFIRVDDELAKTNAELNRKVSELDSLTTYLNNVISSMRSGLVAVDLAGRVVAINAAAEHILRVKSRDAVGRDCDEILAGSTQRSPLRRCLQDGSVEVREREIEDADGDAHIVESSVSPILDSRGNIRGAVEIFQDMTEVKRLRERLHRMDKLAAMGEMAATIAHEIRNPLNGIEGFASLLERDLEPDDERRKFAGYIVDGVRALNKTVTEMLTYTRPQKLSIRDVCINDVVSSAVLFAEQDLQQRQVTNLVVHTERDRENTVVQADPDQLRQALLNIILNATQVMSDGGEIRVFVRAGVRGHAGPDVVEIGIADNGPGMDDDVKSKIFNPFFTARSGGTGLGLAIVHKIVDLHSGDIAVDTQLGRGTTFVIGLPITQGVPASAN